MFLWVEIVCKCQRIFGSVWYRDNNRKCCKNSKYRLDFVYIVDSLYYINNEWVQVGDWKVKVGDT